MGRPLNKRYFGATDGVADSRMPARVKVAANAIANGFILSQRTETRFRVNDDFTGAAGNTGVCSLVDAADPGDNEMIVTGYIAGAGDAINIRKFHNRTVIDFNNNRYTWEVQDDSTSNILVLTAI